MNKQTTIEKLKQGLGEWIRLSLFFLLCMLVMRVIFYLQIHFRNAVAASEFLSILKGSVFDFYLLCHGVAWLAVPFLLCYVFFPKATRKVTMGLIFVYVVVAAILTEYYCNLNMPLDHVVLVYTPEEVKGTATSSAHITAIPFLWFFGTLALLILLGLLWKKVKTGFVFSALVLLVSVVVSLCVPYKQVIREERYYHEHSGFCRAVNQPSYSYIKITDYLRQNKGSDGNDGTLTPEMLRSIQRYQQQHPEFQYVDLEYPFYRKADDPDVLGGFFNQTTDGLPPNFVFIIMESYAQRLTGVTDPMMSCTPFIDSLKREGLYWQNCLSTAERTFGVLPAIFASAPYGKAGFCVTWKPMPYHHSLLRDLKNNGYETSYYYGGMHAFDRFDGFLKANRVDFIYVPDKYEVDSATYQILNEQHRWGLDDRETFQYVMNRKTAQPSSRPNIDIIMTLSTHEPFMIKDVKAYEQRVMDLVNQRPDLPKQERTNIVENLHIFACYLYLDDCVRELMKFYQGLPEYENTIFILTGDHRMSFLELKDAINKYNVPLVIYSPLLSQPKAMDAVVSHLDLTPTLNAYLQANYDYQTDEYCHWLGTSLDTTTPYRNTLKQAFMLNNRDVVDYINGDYMISNNHLFKFEGNLLTQVAEDADVLKRLQSELYDFNVASHYAVQHNHLNMTRGEKELLKEEIAENQLITIDSTMEKVPLMEKLEMRANYEDVMVNLSFDLQSLDTEKALPLVIVRMGTYYMGLKLETEEDMVSLNTGRWEHYMYHLSIPVQQDCTGQFLEIYLLNQTKTNMNYDHVKITVEAVKKA